MHALRGGDVVATTVILRLGDGLTLAQGRRPRDFCPRARAVQWW